MHLFFLSLTFPTCITAARSWQKHVYFLLLNGVLEEGRQLSLSLDHFIADPNEDELGACETFNSI